MTMVLLSISVSRFLDFSIFPGLLFVRLLVPWTEKQWLGARGNADEKVKARRIKLTMPAMLASTCPAVW